MSSLKDLKNHIDDDTLERDDVGPLNKYGCSWTNKGDEVPFVDDSKMELMKEMATELIELQKNRFASRWKNHKGFHAATNPDSWYLSGISDVYHAGEYHPAWHLNCRPFENKVYVCFNRFWDICDYQIS